MAAGDPNKSSIFHSTVKIVGYVQIIVQIMFQFVCDSVFAIFRG